MKVKLWIIGQDLMTKHPLYFVWYDMIRRCYNPDRHNYKYYGGRGIRVCDSWLGKDGFGQFLEDMGERPKNHTLDRKDNDSDYSPDNCKWSTKSEQASNKRGYTNTGYKGIRLNHGKYESWKSYKYLGRFNSLEQALVVQNEA